MKKNKILMILTVLILALGAHSNFALSAHFETTQIDMVYHSVTQMTQKYKPNDILVVFDIDNTLLASNHDLGSVQWFAWQSQLINNGDLDHAVANDISGLISVQQTLYALGSTRKTQENASEILGAIQNLGVSVIALTARGAQMSDSTVRELERHKFHFSKSAIGALGGFVGKYFPYNLKNPQVFGLSPEEVEAWQLKAARRVSYVDGIFMVAGQHKGAMLRTLLKKVNLSFRAIIFVDDKIKNIKKIKEAFVGNKIDLTTVRYTREDINVSEFEAKSKNAVVRQWNKLSNVLTEIFAVN